jgi:hypothetical protein
MGTGIELGQIVSGFVKESGDSMSGVFHQRIGIYINQQALVENRLQIEIGVGGLFWYAFPIIEASPWAASTKFGPGISSAAATYFFGDPETSKVNFKFGFFPLKYKADARNLGEYLFRSPAYPGFVQTGGWWTVNSAFYWAQGAQLHWSALGGFLKNDFTLLMERDFPPMGDLTPSYLFTLNSGGAWELGGGVSYHHLIPVRPSQVAPKDIRNQYVRWTRSDTLVYEGPGIGIVNLPLSDREDSTVVREVLETYSIRGVKLMARGALNLQKALGWEGGVLGPQDLRLFFELAVLGVQNYKFYYEDVTERMPIMFGLNVPAFGFLDVLSAQGEYFRSPFPHDYFNFYTYNLPIWTLDDPDPRNHVDRKADYWKWSVYGAKTVVPGMSLFAQVARDHYRTLDFNGKPAYRSVLPKNDDWYYLLRVEFSI